MSKKYTYKLEITFGNRTSFESLTGTMRISSALDSFKLGPRKVALNYTRTRKQSIEQALNQTRYSRMQELWLLYFAVTGEFPKPKSVIFAIEDKSESYDSEDMDLPRERIPKFNSKLKDHRISTRTCANSVLSSTKKYPILISISYLIRSFYITDDEYGRFRILWGAFNSLYNSFSKNEKAEWKRVRKLVLELDNRLCLEKTKDVFSAAPALSSPCWRLGDYLSSGQFNLTSDGHNSRFSNESRINALVEDADVGTLIALKRHYQYDRLVKNVPLDKNPIEQKIQADIRTDGSQFLFAMIDYLYWLRCDTVHGNSIYPLFVDNELNDLLSTLNDCLEIVIKESISFLASTTMSEGSQT